MSDHRPPKQVMFGMLKGAAKREWGGKEKEWIDCVESDVRAFGIPGDWRRTARDTGGRNNLDRGLWPSGRKQRRMRQKLVKRRKETS